jgi:hypothetical protein
MGCGGWRIIFTVTAFSVAILKIIPGYPDSLLHCSSNSQIPDQVAQIAFKAIWPDEEQLSTSVVSGE